jgi:hypothetical protein
MSSQVVDMKYWSPVRGRWKGRSGKRKNDRVVALNHLAESVSSPEKPGGGLIPPLATIKIDKLD